MHLYGLWYMYPADVLHGGMARARVWPGQGYGQGKGKYEMGCECGRHRVASITIKQVEVSLGATGSGTGSGQQQGHSKAPQGSSGQRRARHSRCPYTIRAQGSTSHDSHLPAQSGAPGACGWGQSHRRSGCHARHQSLHLALDLCAGVQAGLHPAL
jgi:hypothetical protein